MKLLKKVLLKCLALQNKSFAVNQSVNHAELNEFNYFELGYYIVRQSLLETATAILKWGNFVTNMGR